MPDLWRPAESEMQAQGHSLGRVPHDDHEWADALLLFWSRNKRLPDAVEFAQEMHNEWNDPVEDGEAAQVLLLVKGG